MVTFIKLGGSVITDKTREETPDQETIRRLAGALRDALAADPSLRVILGHGSGSFGHVYARRYGIHTGLAPDADWQGFALTAGAALRLNRFVVDALLEAGVPALALQPSATLLADGGTLARWDTANLALALAHGLVPVVHGDVAFDTVQGSAIVSTEQLLVQLAATPGLRPGRIVLVGEAGVFSADPRLHTDAVRIPQIGPHNIDSVLAGAGGSHGADVTGGMRSKVELMWRLVQDAPDLAVQLVAPEPNLVTRALLGTAHGEGTILSA